MGVEMPERKESGMKGGNGGAAHRRQQRAMPNSRQSPRARARASLLQRITGCSVCAGHLQGLGVPC